MKKQIVLIIALFLIVTGYTSTAFSAPVLEVTHNYVYAQNSTLTDEQSWFASVGGRMPPEWAESDFTDGTSKVYAEATGAVNAGIDFTHFQNTGDQIAHIPAGAIYLYASGVMARSTVTNDYTGSAGTWFNTTLGATGISGPTFHLQVTEVWYGLVSPGPMVSANGNDGSINVMMADDLGMDVYLYLPAFDISPGELLTLTYSIGGGATASIGWGAHIHGSAGLHFNLPADIQLGQTASTLNWIHPVPVPGAIWLFGSALICTVGIGRNKKK